MSAIASNLQEVRRRIDAAATSQGRTPSSVRLIAVSKTFPAEDIVNAALAGQMEFGENYVQESEEKIPAVAAGLARHGCAKRLIWHMIGPIQSNKTRIVAELFDWVHTIDRPRIAQRLSDQRPPERERLNVCLQVNITGEASKSGVAPQQLPELARAVADLPRLALRGLMAIPDPNEDPQTLRGRFARMRDLLGELNAMGLAMDQLSMGMSADFESAIAEGATMIRIGTAIFGHRTYPQPAPGSANA